MNEFHNSNRCIALILSLVLCNFAFSDEGTKKPKRYPIRYVATPVESVQDMLWMAHVGKDDIVYDLGSGDGRIVIAAVRDFGAQRAVGVEIDPELVRQSRENAEKAGVSDRVEFIEGDLFTQDFGEATVVTLFLGHAANIELRPKLFHFLKPGARIVSNQFTMGEWKPNKTLAIYNEVIGMYGTIESPFGGNPNVPYYTGFGVGRGVRGKINTWLIPVKLAGSWKGTLETTRGPVELCMELRQTVTEVVGRFHIPENTAWEGSVKFDLWDDRVRWFGMQENSKYDTFNLYFDGTAHDDRMEGSIRITEKGETTERPWTATREVTLFTGTWQWHHDTGDDLPLTLRVEKDGQRTIATLASRGKTYPVTDFYDFRGGFYFTHYFEDGSDAIGGDSGWLIGAAGMFGTKLKGRINFFSPHLSWIVGSKDTTESTLKEDTKTEQNTWLSANQAGRDFSLWEPTLLEP